MLSFIRLVLACFRYRLADLPADLSSFPGAGRPGLQPGAHLWHAGVGICLLDDGLPGDRPE